MTDHQKLIEELEALPFSTVELCGQKVFHYGDRVTRFSDAENDLLTRAAQAIRSLEERVFSLSQSQPCTDVQARSLDATRSDGGEG